MTEAIGPAKPGSRRWLRLRSGSFGFRRLLVAQGGSFLGDGLALAAFPLIAVGLARTPGAVAGVGLAATLPQLLVALPAGLVTDNAERRKTMAAATKGLARRVGRGKLLAASVLALAVGLSGPGMLVDPYTTGAASAVAGFGAGCYNVTSVSFRQRAVPAAVLGRAAAAYRPVAPGAIPLGAVLAGLSARGLGPRGSFLAAGALTPVCLAGLSAVTERALRSAEN